MIGPDDVLPFRDAQPTPASVADPESARDKQIALVGRFAGMNQREASNVLISFGARVVDRDSPQLDWLVIGGQESPLSEAELVSAVQRDTAAAGKLEILHETELWRRLGLIETEQATDRYYTAAMLAHLLGVTPSVIRRWHRRGLIKPVRTLHQLAYYDFQEVATARRLAQWISTGASPRAIERRLVELVQVLPNLQRPLDQLPILVEGKQVLLRDGEGLLEPGGQLRIDFDALDESPTEGARQEKVLSMPGETPETLPIQPIGHAIDPLLQSVYDAEEEGDLIAAIDCCHAVLARDGPRAEVSFLLGELLYRDQQLIAARERYYMAIEQDPEFVEARVNLANVLAETGQSELALAAYRGALDLYEEYPDAHYNLARLLEDLGRRQQARQHWQRFIDLAPESPWAEEARRRLT